MTDDARHLIEQALRLPLSERAAVVAELLVSLDGEADPDADEACPRALASSGLSGP